MKQQKQSQPNPTQVLHQRNNPVDQGSPVEKITSSDLLKDQDQWKRLIRDLMQLWSDRDSEIMFARRETEGDDDVGGGVGGAMGRMSSSTLGVVY